MARSMFIGTSLRNIPDQGPTRTTKVSFLVFDQAVTLLEAGSEDHGFSEEAHANHPLCPLVCFRAFIHGSIPHCPGTNGCFAIYTRVPVPSGRYPVAGRRRPDSGWNFPRFPRPARGGLQHSCHGSSVFPQRNRFAGRLLGVPDYLAHGTAATRG